MNNKYWIVLLIGVLVIGGYMLLNRGGSSYAAVNTDSPVYGVNPTGTTIDTPIPSPTPAGLLKNDVVTLANDPNKGNYITDTKGMTLYVFDNDKANTSNCNGVCAKLWPPYNTKAPTTMPANVSTFKRTDGTTQYSWKNMPLYFYAKDSAPGDISGDGVAGLWHIVIP